MASRFWYLFMVLIVEGSSLTAVELIGAKLLARAQTFVVFAVQQALLAQLGLVFFPQFGAGLGQRGTGGFNQFNVVHIRFG